MKLTQKEVNNINVLILQDAITPRDVQVLGAGIKKLMMSGKNRIIVELTGVSTISADAIRAIGQLDLAARELAGRVLTAGASPQVMKQIEAFATPPIIALFKDLKSAFLEFQKSTKAVDEAHRAAPPVGTANPVATVSAPAPSASAEKTTTAAHAGPKEGLTREEIMEREKAEVTQLRKSITDLEAQNRILFEQITTMTIKRKDMPTESAYLDKIRVLDQEVTELAKQLQDQVPAPKS